MAANRKIAILGAGRIGESLLAGLLSSGWRKPGDIVVTARREERLKELADRHGVKATLSNPEAVADAGLVVIAVKPQDFDVLLGEIGGLLTPEQTGLSVAAAVPTASPPTAQVATTPSNTVWTGTTSANWSVASNWSGGATPLNSATLAFNTATTTALNNEVARAIAGEGQAVINAVGRVESDLTGMANRPFGGNPAGPQALWEQISGAFFN